MKRLLVVFAMLITMANWAQAGENLLALGRLKFGSTESSGFTKGGIPVLKFVVDQTHGIVPIEAHVEYGATVWGPNRLRTSISTTFVIYEEGREATALQREPLGARAVAHAPTRVVFATNGVFMAFRDVGTFKMDRYLPQGRYALYAYIDISGEGKLTEVCPKRSRFSTPSGVLNGNGVVEEVGTAIQLDFSSLTPRMASKLEPKLTVTNIGGNVRVSWPKQFPDYNLECSEVGSSTWSPLSLPGFKEVVTETVYGREYYHFHAQLPADGMGKLFRLVPGGLTEHTGDDLFWPVTQR